MLRVTVNGVEVEVRAWAEEPAGGPVAALADTELRARCLPALVRWRGRSFRCVALWPEPLPPAGPPDPAPADLAGAVLAQLVHGWRCRVCGGRVAALVAEAGLPFADTNRRRHRWATNCPHCGAHVGRARLHALVLLPDPLGS
ncbi:hypothetical protein [Marinitenerispora sediminis]|uniref:Uncharacterized protein n=1 Tax=Marinitenerispora sediminis TaxID=1931232 RepID=A0A368T5K2_9ACTN|nr:hypothetical protein [Marinitenerispora sediminis]RCV57432.1 hypothetical protein DEF28_01625 [Marinitenerispora sediminis]RCV58981.1 hypothetical protein DEF24_11495 [Marinitenerispora sediminis]RCV61273.1 hypothetical protein DEF23_02630 [Marinitenerispora sediminis]